MKSTIVDTIMITIFITLATILTSIMVYCSWLVYDKVQMFEVF